MNSKKRPQKPDADALQKERKKQIKDWLSRIEQNRDWLGGKLNVGKRTVDNWLSTNAAIPDRKWQAIESLMVTETKALPLMLQPFILYPTEEQFLAWDRASRSGRAGTGTIAEWIMQGLERLAAEAYPELSSLPHTCKTAAKKTNSGKE